MWTMNVFLSLSLSLSLRAIVSASNLCCHHTIIKLKRINREREVQIRKTQRTLQAAEVCLQILKSKAGSSCLPLTSEKSSASSQQLLRPTRQPLLCCEIEDSFSHTIKGLCIEILHQTHV